MLPIRLARVRRDHKSPSVSIASDMLVGGIDSGDFNGLRIVSTEVEGVNYNLFNVSRRPHDVKHVSITKEFRLVQGKGEQA